MGWRKKIAKAKKRHRPSLKDWECDGLYETFPEFVKTLPDRSALILSPSTLSASSATAESCPTPDPLLDTASTTPTTNISSTASSITSSKSIIHCYQENLPVRLDAKTLSLDTFRAYYEARGIPCVIDNLPAGYDATSYVGEWPAVTKWTLSNFERTDPIHNPLRRCWFKCGEDNDGNKIKVRLKHFLRYLRVNRDDSPLYIFDSNLLDKQQEQLSSLSSSTKTKTNQQPPLLLHDYTVPSYFREDLFRLVSERRRPPYRWLLIGPARSGSTIHQDPLATNAWNTLLSGQKRWVLFPPHVAKSIVKGRGLIGKNEDDEASHYFMTILPRIKRQAQERQRKQPRRSNDDDKVDDDQYRDFACYEFTQRPGETVFVPHDWWHAVVNLTDTVGVTQNYSSPRNFDAVWRKTRTSRPRMAYKLLGQLEVQYPVLAARARQLNAHDQFRMKYEERERRQRATTHSGLRTSTVV